jgi:hypothetical protein
MAERTIREFSTPSNTNVPTGPTTMVGDGNFKLKTTLLNMVQENPFSDKPNEHANAHLQHFLEVCRTFTIYGVMDDAICFPIPILITREGEAMVLCGARCHKHTGLALKGISHKVLPSG